MTNQGKFLTLKLIKVCLELTLALHIHGSKLSSYRNILCKYIMCDMDLNMTEQSTLIST